MKTAGVVLLAALAGCGSTGGRGGGDEALPAGRREPPPPQFQASTYAEVNYDWRGFGWDFAPFGGPPELPVRIGEKAKADHVVEDAEARSHKYDELVAAGYTPIYQVEARNFRADAARDVVLEGIAERGLGVVLLFVEPTRIEGERATTARPRNPVLRDAFERLARETRLKRREDPAADAPGEVETAARGYRAEGTVWTKLDEPLTTLRTFTDALWTIDEETLLRLGGDVGPRNVRLAADTLRKWARLYPGLKDRALATARALEQRYAAGE